MGIEDTGRLPRILAIGAHPDDCDIKAGGCAILWAKAGCAVRFVSTTNGDAGHHEMSGKELADRRKAEAEAAGRVAEIEYQVLDNRDGQLVPGLEQRWELLRLIREIVARGKPIACLCHGIEILTAAGVIENRRVTTVPKCAMDAEQGGATYVDEDWVEDDWIVTGRGYAENTVVLKSFIRMLGESHS